MRACFGNGHPRRVLRSGTISRFHPNTSATRAFRTNATKGFGKKSDERDGKDGNARADARRSSGSKSADASRARGNASETAAMTRRKRSVVSLRSKHFPSVLESATVSSSDHYCKKSLPPAAQSGRNSRQSGAGKILDSERQPRTGSHG